MDDATQPVTPTQAAGSPITAAADNTPDLSGQTIGEFHILRRLGHGGMGYVYLAEQSSLKRKVALKFLRSDLAANPIALSRFRREAEAVARVTHANIVQVYSIGEADGRHFMALEYVDGRNLRQYLARKGPPDLPVALMIMRQVAAALQRAAESNIVHRDIKPENILLTRKGEVKVADFGLSRVLAGEQDLNLTQDGVVMGTPVYMSPEQAQGNPLDTRSDIYSFGVTCFQMLAGQPPFRGQTALEVALKHVNEQPPSLAELRPDLPPPLVDLVQRMMSKDPAARPQSGREILRQLTQATGAVTGENPFAGLNAAVPGSVRLSTLSAKETTPAPSPAAGGWNLKPWHWAAALLGIVIAGAGGVGLRAIVNARSTPPATDSHPDLPVVSEQERRLLAAIELYSGRKSAPDVRQGAGHYIELGMLYWEQRRFADAERLFEEMAKTANAPAGYKAISNLGLAVTYALRDEVDRSNRLFMDARGQGPTGRAIMPPGALPNEDAINLRHWVVTALDRNVTRPPVPKEIEQLRQDMRRRPNAGPPGKAG
jgi:tRNA A-37 threonylcarbamoyl transferase component Bud32